MILILYFASVTLVAVGLIVGLTEDWVHAVNSMALGFICWGLALGLESLRRTERRILYIAKRLTPKKERNRIPDLAPHAPNWQEFAPRLTSMDNEKKLARKNRQLDIEKAAQLIDELDID